MATVPPPARTRSLAEAHRQVRSPLERLRGYIRAYVGLEGAAVVALYLALWFWIGLLLDYGFFRVFALDWVQVLPWKVRLGILVVLAAGLLAALALAVLTRLFREFADPALALVLERRFPHLLGERLITAVELADLDQATRAGYSPSMVRETVQEAAERVEKLPLQEVFNWRRLYRHWLDALLVALGLYVLVGGAFAGIDSLTEGRARLGGFSGLHQSAGIWFERNVLLRNTIWPRRAYLELVDFPAGGEIKVGRDASPPSLRVRAIKYVIADGGAAEGWRAMTWQDLRDRRWLLADEAPAPPGDWEPRDAEVGLTVDEAELALRRFEVREDPAAGGHWQVASPQEAEGWRPLLWSDLNGERLGGLDVPALPAAWKPNDPSRGLTLDEVAEHVARGEQGQAEDLADLRHVLDRLRRLAGVRSALDRLDERLEAPGLQRLARRLIIPDTVYVAYSGITTSSRMTLQRGADNLYSGQFTDLKESVGFTAQGEDYYTARRYITVVPPPALVSLVRLESRPAYLYYRPAPGSRPEELRGLKQLLEKVPVSVTGGDTSRIDLPAGTDVVLTAEADKDLESVKVVPRKSGLEIKHDPPELLDARTFRVRFPEVRQEQSFVFEFTDRDGVAGSRQVVLKPAEDQPPEADVEPQVVRKTKDGYLVTPLARIPFAGKVRDDNGLGEVQYAYTLARVESGVPNLPLLLVVATVPALAPTGRTAFPGLVELVGALKEAAKPTAPPPDVARVERVPVARFQQALMERDQEILPQETIKERLGQRQSLPYRELLRVFEIKPDELVRTEEVPIGYDFPLARANLKVTDERQTQPRYRMQLWLEAVDTDLESEREKDGRPRPHLTPSKERYTFLIVSENELLTEIGYEEERLYLKLEDMVNRLLETQNRLNQVNLDLAGSGVKAENLGPMSARTEDIDQVLEKGQKATEEVYADYQRIRLELMTNRVDPRMIDRVEQTIVKPLGEIADFEFPRTRDANAEFRKALDQADLELAARLTAARAAGARDKEQLRTLIGRVNAVLGAMQGVIDINKLIAVLRKIEEEEQKQFDQIKKVKDELELKLLEGALDKPK